MLTVDAAEEFAQNWMPVSEEKLICWNSYQLCQTPVKLTSTCQHSLTGQWQTFELMPVHVVTAGHIDYWVVADNSTGLWLRFTNFFQQSLAVAEGRHQHW